MSKMLKSSGAMGAATLLSRVLGMVREMVYANFMGGSEVAGAFKMAFKIPNLFRRLLGEGALTAAFIPIFKEKEKNSGPAEMWRAANAVVSGLVLAGSAITALAILGITIALPLLEPKLATSTTHALAADTNAASTGLVHAATASAASTGPILEGGIINPSTSLMLRLLRIMFPYLLMVCLAAVFIGMLNARGRFFVPALGSVVLNVVLIGVVYLFAPLFGRDLPHQVFALAWGVLLAGFAQLAFQLPALFKEGFKFEWVTPWQDPVVREVVRKMIPGTIGVASFQLNVILTDVISAMVDLRIVAWFDYAVRFMELPQGIFGISLATYLLPTLSGLAAEKKFPEFRQNVAHALSYLVFLNTLASIFLVILAEPMIRLIFEHGKFLPEDTEPVAHALAALGLGLLAFSGVNILARAFYALGDTKTPMRISIFCLGVNLILSAALILPYEQSGIAVANTLTAIMNAVLLAFALKKKLGRLDWTEVRAPLFRIVTAGAAAGVAAWLLLRFADGRFGHNGLWPRIIAVFLPMTVATGIYLGVAFLLRVPAAKEVTSLLLGRLARKNP